MYLIKTKNIVSFDNLFEEKECETYEESVYGKEEYKRRSRYFNFQGAGAGDFDDFLNPLSGNSTATPKFLKPANLINIMRQISNVGIMAVGEAMVIIIAGIDLSVGATLSLSACVAAYLAQVINPWLAVLVALLTGLSIGMINGFLSVKIGIAPFIATLGTQMMARRACVYGDCGYPHQVLERGLRAGRRQNRPSLEAAASGSDFVHAGDLYNWNCGYDADRFRPEYLCGGRQ